MVRQVRAVLPKYTDSVIHDLYYIFQGSHIQVNSKKLDIQSCR